MRFKKIAWSTTTAGEKRDRSGRTMNEVLLLCKASCFWGRIVRLDQLPIVAELGKGLEENLRRHAKLIGHSTIVQPSPTIKYTYNWRLKNTASTIHYFVGNVT